MMIHRAMLCELGCLRGSRSSSMACPAPTSTVAEYGVVAWPTGISSSLRTAVKIIEVCSSVNNPQAPKSKCSAARQSLACREKMSSIRMSIIIDLLTIDQRWKRVGR